VRYVWLIGRRYLRPRYRDVLISVLSAIATVGVMFAVAAPQLTLSVMNGFEREVRQRIVNTNYNVFVMSRGEFRDYRAVMDSIAKHPQVLAMSPFVRREALISFGPGGDMARRLHGCYVYGVDARMESLTTRVVQAIKPGFYGFDSDLFDVDGRHLPGIVLGVDLAKELTVSLGDVVTLASPADSTLGTGSEPHIVQRRFRVIGLLNSGFYEFDAQLAYISLQEAQSFFGFEGRVYGIGVRLRDIYAADHVGAQLDEQLGFRYYTNNWMFMFRNVFTWMETERKLMTLVFIVIISIAAITVLGMLTMIVMEKRKAIGILKSLGASRAGIMSIFIIQGTAIGLAGAILGSGLGWLACRVVDRIGIDLPGDVYIIDTLPVAARATDFLVVGAVAVLLCFLATLYPSWAAARLDPVDAIRYE
jgi:lipoprotein-releasing system permease protein